MRETRNGRKNDPRFGSRMTGEGPYADVVKALLEAAARKHGLALGLQLDTTPTFTRPPRPGQQLRLL